MMQSNINYEDKDKNKIKMNWSKDIKPMEKYLGKSIKKDTLAIGVDLASNITGFCLLKTNKNTIELVDTDFIDLSKLSRGDKRYIKMDAFLDEVHKFFKKHKVSEYKSVNLYIEDCFFGKSVESFQKLCEYHSLFYSIAKQYVDNVYFILPNVARANIKFSNKSKVKKDEVKGKVHLHVIRNFKFKFVGDYNLDIMDAFVLALTALIEDDEIWTPVVKHRKTKSKSIRKKYSVGTKTKQKKIVEKKIKKIKKDKLLNKKKGDKK